MTLGRLAWLVGVALLVLVVNVVVSILYMVVYGHLIDQATKSNTTATTSRSSHRITASLLAFR